jgi:putative NADH-flavin reductase
VTAFVRSPERLKPFGDRIAVKQGNLLNGAELEPVVKGHDALLSGFGPRLPVAKADANLLQQFGEALTAAMPQTGVRRVVIESVAFLFKDSIIPPAYLLGRLLFPSVVADAFAMEKLFRESGLDWTIVRPPELTDEIMGPIKTAAAKITPLAHFSGGPQTRMASIGTMAARIDVAPEAF